MIARQKEIRQKNEYLATRLPARRKNLLEFLMNLPDTMPRTLVLKGITQQAGSRFSITGSGLIISHIWKLVEDLSQMNCLENVDIGNIRNTGMKDKKEILPYDFSITIILKG